MSEDYPVIMCAVCGTLVHKAVFSYDEMAQMTLVTVRCHGQTDRMLMSEQDKRRLGSEGLRQIAGSVGLAFDRPQPAQILPSSEALRAFHDDFAAHTYDDPECRRRLQRIKAMDMFAGCVGAIKIDLISAGNPNA